MDKITPDIDSLRQQPTKSFSHLFKCPPFVIEALILVCKKLTIFTSSI